VVLGGCPSIGIDRFVAPEKPALPPFMAVVVRGSHCKASFSIIGGEQWHMDVLFINLRME